MVSKFGEPTDTLLRNAHNDSYLYGQDALSMEQRVLLALADGQWHGGRALAIEVSHRFGGYLHTLKGQGVAWEKRLDPERPRGKAWWQYRLVPTDPQLTLM